jgi:hypothetical protein
MIEFDYEGRGLGLMITLSKKVPFFYQIFSKFSQNSLMFCEINFISILIFENSQIVF